LGFGCAGYCTCGGLRGQQKFQQRYSMKNIKV
jgi:hypothetical protein